MIFITTSDFSSGALTYAKETGVDLINGLKLVELLKAQGFYQESKISIAPKEWQLQVAERFSREEELEAERALQLNS